MMRPAHRRRIVAHVDLAARLAAAPARAISGAASCGTYSADRQDAHSAPPGAGFRPALQRVDEEQQQERRDQHHGRDRGRVRVAEFLQPDDDQQRRDLRHVRQVAGDEDDRAVLADRAREREREAGQQRRARCSAARRGARSVQRLAPSEAAASSSSFSRSSSTGCTVRTTNGRPMKTSATKMPSGVNATLMPSGASRPPSQPFSA